MVQSYDVSIAFSSKLPDSFRKQLEDAFSRPTFAPGQQPRRVCQNFAGKGILAKTNPRAFFYEPFANAVIPYSNLFLIPEFLAPGRRHQSVESAGA